MKALLLIFVFLFLIAKIGFAQGELDDQRKALIRNERTINLQLNSNGWGMGYSFCKMININRKTLWNTEFNYLKDIKEIKITNPNYTDGGRFVFGKKNEFFNFRVGYGNLNKLFEKKDKGGIEISYFYQGGFLLGLEKPIYYVTGLGNQFKIEKFNLSADIYGKASFFKGFNELKVVPGVFAKLGSRFEYSKKDLTINALEGGVILELYPRKIEVMANSHNQLFFFSLFVGYRFGRVLNPRIKAIKPE